MVQQSTIKWLEKAYKCRIAYDMWDDVFRIFSLDGCHWSTVIGYRTLRSELARDKASLARIASHPCPQ